VGGAAIPKTITGGKMIKRLFLIFILMAICSPAFAQCVAEVVDVYQHPVRKNQMVVETKYTINGIQVDNQSKPCSDCTGKPRYTKMTGKNPKIIDQAKKDMRTHCRNLIKRIAENKPTLESEKSTINSDLTDITRTIPKMVTNIKPSLVGHKETVSQVTIKHHLEEITIDATKFPTEPPINR
jgi:hypothetical protein